MLCLYIRFFPPEIKLVGLQYDAEMVSIDFGNLFCLFNRSWHENG